MMNDEIRMTNDEAIPNDRNDKCPTFNSVIPSGVENGAAGEAATWTGRRRLNEREVSESKSLD